MIVVAGLNKREVRRMLLLGIPWFVTTLICAQSLSSIWFVLFAFVALLPYSYFYVLAYTNFQANIGRPPGWRFYVGSVVAQLLVIGLMWAGASIKLFVQADAVPAPLNSSVRAEGKVP